METGGVEAGGTLLLLLLLLPVEAQRQMELLPAELQRAGAPAGWRTLLWAAIMAFCGKPEACPPPTPCYALPPSPRQPSPLSVPCPLSNQ